jgi:hypothetical protein
MIHLFGLQNNQHDAGFGAARSNLPPFGTDACDSIAANITTAPMTMPNKNFPVMTNLPV